MDSSILVLAKTCSVRLVMTAWLVALSLPAVLLAADSELPGMDGMVPVSAQPAQETSGSLLPFPDPVVGTRSETLSAAVPANPEAISAPEPVQTDLATYAEPIAFTLPSEDNSEHAPESSLAQAGDLFRAAVEFREAPGMEGEGDATVGGDDAPRAVPSRGYFPTREEWRTLGGYRAKSWGDSPVNPGGDAAARQTLAVSGLWPYQPPSENPSSFFARHDPFFGPIERVAGILAYDVREGWSYEGGGFQVDVPFAADLQVPFLTRGYNPERATLKLGPLHWDLLAVSGSMLYSQYEGTIDPFYAETDGWISVIDVSMRAVLQFTENMFLSLQGTLSYYPDEGDFGFRLGYGSGLGLGTVGRFVYEKEFARSWLFQVVDVLKVRDFFEDLFLYDLEVNELATSGRYRFGSNVDRSDARRGSGDFWDESRLFLSNALDVSATGPIARNWMTRTGIGREDYWAIEGWDHQSARTYLFTNIDYSGSDLRFAPYFRYRTHSTGSLDNDWGTFDVWRHVVATGIRGPLTETLRLEARTGYTFVSGGDEWKDDIGDSWLYEMGLTHEFGPYTRHSLFMGNVIDYDVDGDERLAEYMRYSLDQRFGRRLRATGFVQGADVEETGDGNYQQFLIGGTVTFYITDFTRLAGTLVYEEIDSDEVSGRESSERWIYRASVDHRLLPGLFAGATYQYEDYTEPANGYFEEHLVILTLTKTF